MRASILFITQGNTKIAYSSKEGGEKKAYVMSREHMQWGFSYLNSLELVGLCCIQLNWIGLYPEWQDRAEGTPTFMLVSD